MSTAIVWFRRDLRLADNPALCAACAAHQHIVPVYIDAPEELAPWQPGSASRWWLHHSLASFQAVLGERGTALVVRQGASLPTLRTLASETGASAVYWNRCYEPAEIARDTAVKVGLREIGLQVESCNAALIAEPWAVATGAGEPYRVFTPFWRNVVERPVRSPLPIPEWRPGPVPASVPLAALGLLPTRPWDGGLRAAWTPGEAGAAAEARRFFTQAAAGYALQRDFPAEPGTSRLSPHLHFGEIGPVQLHALARQLQPPDGGPGFAAFWRELGWREFAHHLLYHYPRTTDEPLDRRYQAFPWRGSATYAADLRAWQRGVTGIDIVDAGMRELWHTGWMHNRVRMLVASLLTKNLRIPWQAGARWFWDTLVDADLANNTLGWQWTAGCGADAAPYFRIFNPMLQAKKFDPDGAYVQRWLAHAPAGPGGWQVGASASVSRPIVDLAASRAAALAAYDRIRGER